MPFRSSSGYNGGGTTSTNLVFTKPAGTVSGDRLLCHIWERGDSGNVSPPSGWSLVRKSSVVLGGDAGFSFYTFTKVAGGSEPSSYTFTSTKNQHNSGVMTAYSGVSAIGVETGTTGTASGNNVTAPSVAGTAGHILVAAWGVDGGSAGPVTWTPAAGMTERADSGYVSGVSAADLTLASTGATGTKTATYSGGFSGSRCAAHTLTLVTNTAPNAPTITSLTGGQIIDRANTNRASWTFSDPDAGDTPSKFDLRYRLVGAGSWTTITETTPNSFYDFVGGALAAGDYEWQVRTYDALGVVGPYSASSFFTAATAPNPPTITAPINGETVAVEDYLVAWSTPDQDSYQLRRVADAAGSPNTGTVYEDTGEVVAGATRDRLVSFTTNARYEHVQIRVKDNGLWSSWASVRVLVSYTQPAEPTLSTDSTTEPGAIIVTPAQPAPGVGQPTVTAVDVYRREAGDTGDGIRVAAESAPTAPFTDWAVAAGVAYEYRVRAFGDNGASSWSDWTS